MKQVMIYAYTANNLGDDLFIYILCKRYPNTKFFLYAPSSYYTTFKDMPNVLIINNEHLLLKISNQIFKVIRKPYFYREKVGRKCPIGVYIGGSIFMEKPNWKKEAENVRSMIHTHEHFFILGANFGPFKKVEFYQTYEHLFQQVTDICFRDHVSYSLFQHLENVRQASDVVFQLGEKRSENNDENTVVISVIYPSIRKHLVGYDDIYFQAMKDITIKCIEQGYTVKLMAFCKLEKDDIAIEEIMKLIPETYHSKLLTYRYHSNIVEALNQIKQAKAVIATRFHAMILGWVFHKPVFPIVYSNKMKTVMDDLAFKGLYSHVKHLDKLNIDNVISAIHGKPINIEHQKQDATKQFAKLDQLLLKDRSEDF